MPTPFDEIFSHQDYTGKSVDIPDNTIVYQSCFSHELPDSIVFRDTMTGVQFFNCNLDNCLIPPGNTLVDCTTRRFKAQDDGNDWIVDTTDTPISPVTLETPTEEIAQNDVATLLEIETPQTVSLDGIVRGKWVFIKE